MAGESKLLSPNLAQLLKVDPLHLITGTQGIADEMDDDHSSAQPQPKPDQPSRTASTASARSKSLSLGPLSLHETPTATVPAGPVPLFPGDPGAQMQRQQSYHAPVAADSASTDPMALTPLRAHYLKRELVTQQFGQELESLSTPDALALLGPPFLPKERFVIGMPVDAKHPNKHAPPARQRSTDEEEVDIPFLRFFFHHFVLSFPFLVNAPKTFFSHKLQPFLYSFFSRNISGTDDREEETSRRRLAGKIEKHLGLVMAAAIKLADNQGREEVVRVAVQGAQAEDAAPNDDDAFVATPEDEKPMAVAAIAGASTSGPVKPPDSSSTSATVTQPAQGGGGGFDVNVVGIRHHKIKGRVRSKVHEEFIIRTRYRGWDDVFVCRRYGDFTKLAETLRSEFPEADVRSPPAKDRRSVTGVGGDDSSPSSPAASTPPHASQESLPQHLGGGSGTASPLPEINPAPQSPPQLARERNRLTLRAYLHRLLRKPELADSETMRSFLLGSPISLTEAELDDVARREGMDRERERELARFRKEVEGRVAELEGHLRGFREELVRSDGLSRVFGTIREKEKVEDLPIEYRKVLEWARISMASTIYQLFLGSDNSSSAFAQLKRMHGLMPYWAMRGVLRISNPVAMIRGVLDLFLARPFGASSLLQRMFSSGLQDEVKEYRADAEKVANKVAEERFCLRVRNFIAAPKEIQDVYEADALSEKVDIMSIILRSPEGPAYDRTAAERITRAEPEYEKYKAYRDALTDPSEDRGPATEDGWLFEDLHVYMRLLRRARDKEQLIELIFEGTTSELLKDIVTIFYAPLMQVYKAANIADSLWDLQKFLDDLIRTVERAEEFTFGGDPQRVVQTFVDLVGRHEGAFYHFVHQVHSKGAGLFDGLMRWIELFVNFVREGLPEPVSLEVLLPHSGAERAAILAEVDEIVEYHRRLKVAHHERMMRRVARGQEKGGGGALDMAKEQDAAFVHGVMNNLHLAKVVGDVDDMANEDEQSDEEDEGFDDAVTEMSSGPSSPTSMDQNRPLDGAATKDGDEASSSAAPPAQTHSIQQQMQQHKKKHDAAKDAKAGGQGGQGGAGGGGGRQTIEPPVLRYIPQLTPVFTEVVKQLLQRPGAQLAGVDQVGQRMGFQG